MALSQQDRIIFSSKIVSADSDIISTETAKSQVQIQLDKAQQLDTANKNLLDPINVLVTSYQNEFNQLDGKLRYSFVENDIVNSAKRVLKNFFFPNDINTNVPHLSSVNNVWTQIKPYALTQAIGKDSTESYGTTDKEEDKINAVLGYITNAQSYLDIENTTGQHCGASGVCSLTQYTNQTDCVNNGGIWTAGPDVISDYTDIHTLKDSIVSAVGALKTFLNNEVSLIVTGDTDSTRQIQNQAAIDYINNTLIPAIDNWLSYSDFNTSHGQTTCVGFYAYDPNLLAPTKLHSTQLASLQSLLTSRLSFISTRVGQLTTNLGDASLVTQDITTGEVSFPDGLYKTRYNFLVLRIDALIGSLSRLLSIQNTLNAQTSLVSSISTLKNTYSDLLVVSLFKAPANGTDTINIINSSNLSAGDTVFIVSDNQEEIQRGIKSVQGTLVVLNDTVSAKYLPDYKARIYKDIS